MHLGQLPPSVRLHAVRRRLLQAQERYVSCNSPRIINTDARYAELLQKCTSGLAFKETLHHPTDSDGKIRVLKAPPRAVRSSSSSAWRPVIEEIDAFLASKHMNVSVLK